ncbi:DUF4136 domain-containing protein [Sphingosinicella sp. YJ22]|uniref:DUF4136 domain-containing protein n=1 Tax=Sphingosinicella sp. YJ22 TaxID=1104780 RepID=UPI0014080756|nr:DUF4136 domain-containing protein [Sphingosinicella sp. YJ22]
MKLMLVRGAAIGLAALIAGCATNGGMVSSGVDVTRFHLGHEPARGTISVEPIDATQAGSFEFNRFANAVERELTRLGWQVTRGNVRSEQVALVRVNQGARQGARRSGLSIGLGGGYLGGGFGAGGGVQVPIGGSRPNMVVDTELAVRLQRRSDGSAIWEGRAQMEALGNSPLANAANAVDRLAPALFQGFPGESGRTIRVP